MLYKNNNPFDQKTLRRASWLALLSLAWLQLTLASHQFNHVAAYFADSCHVCVQLDRIDDAVAEQPASVDGAPENADAPRQVARHLTARPVVRHFHSRAPPLI